MAGTVLLTCEAVSKGYGAQPVFEGLTFTLNEGDHVGLIGPNGAGKSTLLKILAGVEEPDSGTRALRRTVRIGYVPQEPMFAPGRNVEDVVTDALDGEASLEEYEKASRVGIALGKCGFTDRAENTDILSGGWRKRLAIACELVREPDILLLDEPTNHLDVESILWLERLLRSEPEAFVVVSHDRYFLENVARRMLELNRVYADGLLQVDGSYADLLEKRDELLRNQAAYQETLANLVRREVEWLRRGAKARTRKSKARIQNAERLIDDLQQSRSRTTGESAGLDFTASERRTKRLWVGRGLHKRMGDRTIAEDLDLLLTPGVRLGVLGPNGSGKTTLLRMIVGELEPDGGTIETADQLRIVYFEQNRESLDPEVSLKRALAPESDSVVFRDRLLHVASWAKRFLFRSDQLEMPVGRLSGGEKARVVLARLMLQPADLLVLDEPTNDLDIPTLDVLEESLLDFPGALVLVTHDRYMIDRVSTHILALDGRGGTAMYADYTQWEEQRGTPATPKREPSATDAGAPKAKSKRLSYRDQREWDAMEVTLLVAESRVAAARRATEDPSVSSDATELHRRFTELSEAESEVERLYQRWAELEEKRGQ
jgi:ABC transport system ATP-binding/permease protein